MPAHPLARAFSAAAPAVRQIFCALAFFALGGAHSSLAAPPAIEVRLVEPGELNEVTTSPVLVKLALRIPPGETLLGIRVLVDGRLAAQARGLKLVQAETQLQAADAGAAVTHLISVPVPSHDCALTVVAEGVRGKSAPMLTHLRWRGAALDPAQRAAQGPKLYLLSVGVSDYDRTDLRLRFAAKDAADVATVFRAQQGGLYRTVAARVLSNHQATKGNVLDGLEWLQHQTTAKDVAVLFLAGHGITDPSTGAFYFLPSDADPGAVKRTMIAEGEIRSTLANIAGKTLFFIDTCHSGKVFNDIPTRDGNDLRSFISELAAADNGVVVFAASTGRQASQEAAEWNNGAFTRAVIEGLRGRADFHRSGRITINMLDLYISARVKELTAGKQTPTTAKPSTVPDFPVALVPEFQDDDVTIFR